jgi:hypothetical protein
VARTRAPRRSPAPPPAPAATSGAASLGALALVLLAAFALHAGALRAPFFADDFLFLDQVRGRGLTDALTAPDPLGNFFRPIGRAFHFWAVARVGGESPALFHAANLGLALCSIALLFAIAKRLAGVRAAAIAAAFLALHHALDVPVLWASGSQDLLALAGALAAIALHQRGAGRLSAGALLVGLLSKETVALTPLVAIVVARAPGEPWSRAVRKAVPLLVAVVVWAIVWLVTAGTRTGAATTLEANPAGIPAAIVQLVRAALGIEWRADRPWAVLTSAPPWVALALAAAAVACSRWGRARTSAPAALDDAGPRRARNAGLVWAVCGALPVAPVAAIWSAYYFLFAIAGAGLALGGALARAPAWLAIVVVAALGASADGARRLDEFATARGAWTAQSHVNRFYLDRAMRALERHLGAMKRLHPTLEPRTTVFFAGLPPFIAVQAADGPLVRWAWRDTSLRSYYVNGFTRERANRGPVIVLVASGDTLRELRRDGLMPLELAYGSMLSDRLEPAREAIAWKLESAPDDEGTRYWAAWLAWAAGDTVGGRAHLAHAGIAARGGPGPEPGIARARFVAGDTAGAVALMQRAVRERTLDPDTHATLADLLLVSPAPPPEATIEAYAARALAPGVAWHWWRWGYLQARNDRYEQAAESLDRYFALGGADAATNEAARRLREQVRRAQPGGELVQKSLRQ